MPRPHRSAAACALACALAVPTFAPAAATQPATQPATLPLKEVTLYTSGVGFFVHSGAVTDDGATTLKFKTAQINDVLKSLVVTDFGGHVTGVQYPSRDPTDKTLKDFQIDLSNNPSLGELLRQLRGATVTMDFPGAGIAHTGVIVGLTKRSVAAPQVAAVDAWFVTLMEPDDRLTQLRLDDAVAIKLADPTLNAELQTALSAIAINRNADKRPVTVSYTGKGDHELTLGYVVETPLWKTSYRLTLSKKQSAIQGWAVVENQTDADWKDVSLNLVSGRPISFVMDLYKPLYVQRPTVQLDLFQGLKPQVYAGGMAGLDVMSEKDGTQMKARMDIAASPAPAASAQQHLFGGGRDDDSVEATALTAKLGELFEYNLKHVTLPRQQSSLVPIVTGAIASEPLSVFNADVLPRNPLNGVLLTNSTGKLLPQGPITVLDHGTYAGDARIEDLPAGQKRLLTFGVDLQTLVDVKDEQPNGSIVSGKISKGVLTVTQRETNTKTYAIENKGDDDKTVVIESPIPNDNWTLYDSPKPMEKTDRVYRFRVAVPKTKRVELKVNLQDVGPTEVRLVDDRPEELLVLSRETALSQKVRDAVAEVVKRRQALIDFQRQVKEKTDALDGIGTEQQRIRQNMQSVTNGGPYYNRMLAKLNDQEGVIEGLQKDRDDLNQKMTAARSDLENYLTGLELE